MSGRERMWHVVQYWKIRLFIRAYKGLVFSTHCLFCFGLNAAHFWHVVQYWKIRLCIRAYRGLGLSTHSLFYFGLNVIIYWCSIQLIQKASNNKQLNRILDFFRFPQTLFGSQNEFLRKVVSLLYPWGWEIKIPTDVFGNTKEWNQ